MANTTTTTTEDQTDTTTTTEVAEKQGEVAVDKGAEAETTANTEQTQEEVLDGARSDALRNNEADRNHAV